MIWLVFLLLCALIGGVHPGFGDSGHQEGMPGSYRDAPIDQAGRRSAAPGATGSNGSDDPATADYLRTITEQRSTAAKASETLREFLLEPASLDQRRRTQVLQAVATLHDTATAAAALVPPPNLATLHAEHVAALETMANAGALYTAGMDTHDPTQWDRASRVLAEGTARFDAVGKELDRLAPPN